MACSRRDPLPHVLNLAQIILAHGLLRYLCETQLRDRDQIGSCPWLDSDRWTLTGSEKELAQAMLRSLLILLGCFAGTHQIAQCFGTLVWNPHRRQIPGSMATCKLLCMPPIRLYPITCLQRHKRGCDDLGCDAQLRKLPVHDVARRSGFVTCSQLVCRTKLLNQPTDRLSAVGNRSHASRFTFRLRDRYGDRLGIDIQT